MFEGLSIRSKLLALLGLSSALALLVFSLVALYSTYVNERAASLRDLHQMADVIAENLRAAVAFHDAASVDKLLAPLKANPHILLAQVRDEHEHLLGSYQDTALESTQLASLEETISGFESRLTTLSRLDQFTRNHHLVVHRIELNDIPLGSLSIVSDNEGMFAKMRSFILVETVTTVIIFIGLLLLSLRLQAVFTAPLDLLINTMRSIASDQNYQHRIKTLRKDEFGELYQGFNAMLAEIRKRDDALNRLARTDALTGLANRREVLEKLEKMAIRSARKQEPMGLIMLDVDHFKRINDRYGHPAGDLVLRELADILRASARPYDLAGRFGGEEFILLCEHADLATSKLIAERLRLRTAAHTFVLEDGQSLQATISLGVHAAIADPGFTSKLIEAADQALYAAKSNGRNRTCTSTDLQAHA
ncbi:MAG: diguanylate cyclase [Thauera sp.]|jgi:diguanylate cyclase (GGDEF)-like protein|nr:diguanylate cyclase [Thauera sp.]